MITVNPDLQSRVRFVQNAYLVGPMEFADPTTPDWRRTLEPRLSALVITCFNPLRDSFKIGPTVEYNKVYAAELKREGRWKELIEFVERIWHQDRDHVTRADALIACIPSATKAGIEEFYHSVGTLRELQEAYGCRIPSFLIFGGNVAELSSHLLDLFLWEGAIFKNEDELVEYFASCMPGNR